MLKIFSPQEKLGIATQTSAFTPDDKISSSIRSDTASRIYAICYKLLRASSLGPGFLEFCIPILSAVRRLTSILLRQRDLFGANERTKQILDQFLVAISTILNETLAHSRGFISDRLPDLAPFRRSLMMIQGRKDRLIDELWTSQLPFNILSSQNSIAQVGAVRDWLMPNDEVVRILHANLWATRTLPTEFTCEWFSKTLLEFLHSSDKALLVEGPEGCGKSVLYGWIVDSLQGQVGSQEYNVLNHSLDPLLPSELAVSCLLKQLLQTAFEHHPGLQSLWTALTKAIDTAATSNETSTLNEDLWNALDLVMRNPNQRPFIVIDGLNDLAGGDNAVRAFLQRMIKSVSQIPAAKFLVLVQSSDYVPGAELRRFTIQPLNIYGDIRCVTDKALKNYSDAPPEVREWISGNADGNFLWTKLILQIWQSEVGQVNRTSFKSLPTSLDAAVSLIVSKIDFDDATTRLLLIFLLVAVRPLRTDEVQSLLSMDVASKSFNRKELDITHTIDNGCKSILTVDDGIIRFRHPVFKRSLFALADLKLKYSVREIHVEMVTRLLLYLKLGATARFELTLKPIDPSVVGEILRSNQLMSYALRFWTDHYRQAGLARNYQMNRPDSDLGPVFPNSSFFAALESSYWGNLPLYDALRALNVARQARQDILGMHPATLQTSALLGTHFKRVKNLPEASVQFAVAFQLGRQLLPEFHDFIADCILECLETIHSIDDSAGLELPVTVPEMLRYLISKYSQQFGQDSDQALESHQQLARYYVESNQPGLSAKVHHDIYKLTMDRFGKSSFEAKAVAGELAALIHKSDHSEDDGQDEVLVDDNVTDTFAVTDTRRIKASITRAKTWKAQNDQQNAEIEYLKFMHEITDGNRHLETDKGRSTFAKIGLLYADFLSEQDRLDEAQSVLLGVRSCLEGQRQRDNATNELTKDLARQFQQNSLPALALTVLVPTLTWSKLHNATDADVLDIEDTILDISGDLVAENSSGLVLPKTTEDTFIQILDYVKSQDDAKAKVLAIDLCQSLIDSFTLERRWQEVVRITSGVLFSFWPAILQNPEAAPELGSYDPALVDLALGLSQAYSMIDAEATAGSIYWLILRLAKYSNVADSAFFVGTARAAIRSFENAGQSNRVIDVMHLLFDHYQTTVGENADPTVDISYELASLFMGRGDIDAAETQYERTSSSLQRSDAHDRRVLPALQALIVIYHGKKLWDQAEKVYASLWRAFLAKGKDYRIREDTASILYRDYSRLMEQQVRHDARQSHRLLEEYRWGCESAFGKQALITVEATMRLARSW